MRYTLDSMLPERAFQKRGFGYTRPGTLEGGGGGIISSIGNAVSGAVQGIGGALAGLDKAVGHAIPGGWVTLGGLALGGAAAGFASGALTLGEAVAEGAAASDLAAAGASASELVDAGLSASQLVDAGMSATQLVDAGLSASELADAGLSTSEMLDAGLSTSDLVDSGVVQELSGGNLIDSTTGELLDTTGKTVVDASTEGLQADEFAGIKADPNGNLIQTFDDGSTMTMDQSGNVIGSTEAPPDPNSTLDKLGQKAVDYAKNKVTSTLANKALSGLLAPATKALATGTGLKTGAGAGAGTGLNSLSSASPTTSEVPTLTPTFGGGTTGAPITLQGGTFAQSALPSVYNVPSASAPAASTGNQFEAAAANPSMTPMFAEGGSVGDAHVPEFYSEGGLNNRYVKGDGDGTSDDVPAMLANGEFVIPADVVAALGNGSNDSGSKVLDNFLSVIREHKQKHDSKHLPPDSKGALAYLLSAKNKVGK